MRINTTSLCRVVDELEREPRFRDCAEIAQAAGTSVQITKRVLVNLVTRDIVTTRPGLHPTQYAIRTLLGRLTA